jgi:Arylsulfotransferase (ASST)
MKTSPQPLAIVLLSSFGIAACAGGDVGGSAYPGAGADSGVFADACTVDDSLFVGLSVAETTIPTVPSVTWSTDVAGTGWLVFEGEDGELAESAAVGPTTTHALTVRGLHAKEEATIRAYVETDSGVSCSESFTWTADSLPASLPSLGIEGEAVDDYTAIPLFTEEGNSIAVVDGEGEYVWHQENHDLNAWRVRQALDGDGFLFNLHPSGLNELGAIYRVDWNGTRTELASDVGLHTDFVELSDGTVAGLTWDVRDVVETDGTRRTLVGDSITEYPKDGLPRVVWSVWDDFVPDLSIDWPVGDGSVAADAEDWSHVNSISFDEERNQYLVTVTSIQGVVAVDRTSGDLVWSASASEGTLSGGSGELMRNPHSVSRVDGDEYVVFNRGNLGVDCSNATRFTVDEANETLTGGDVYAGQDCTSVTYLGQAAPLSDGGMFVVWTTAGRIDRIDADQELKWALTSQLGAAFGFSTPMASLYP